jgi:DNA-binding NtrC family response regulator
MPGKDGMQLFDYMSEHCPDVPVIFLTAYGTVESAVSAITRGAYYYFIKPPDYLNLKSVLARSVEQRCLKRELEALRKRLSDKNGHCRTIGNTPEMRKVLDTVEGVKDSSSSVLILGETGTGKEPLARALHYGSKKQDTPFIAVNCAAIPKELMESELFGYEKGAFTGAVARRVGRFEEASGGTVFLDEIGELELSLQSKLLRVLQEREIERLGSSRKIKVDFRLVSSTNRDLRKEVEAGRFREDLFYRLNVVEIKVPPLRERKDDIPLLVSEFVNEFCIREKKSVTLSDQVMNNFLNYSWPGNIRQLRNVIERAIVLCREGRVTHRELPEEFRVFKKQRTVQSSTKTLKDIEMQAVKEALQASGGNKSRASKTLGISRKAFYKRLRECSAE